MSKLELDVFQVFPKHFHFGFILPYKILRLRAGEIDLPGPVQQLRCNFFQHFHQYVIVAHQMSFCDTSVCKFNRHFTKFCLHVRKI